MDPVEIEFRAVGSCEPACFQGIDKGCAGGFSAGADGAVRWPQVLRDRLRRGGPLYDDLGSWPEPAGGHDGLRRGGRYFTDVGDEGIILSP